MPHRHTLTVALVALSLLVLSCGAPEPAPATDGPVASATPAPPTAPSLPFTATPSPTDTPPPTDTPGPTHTPSPDEAEVSVPPGHGPTIDGILSPGEWAGALRDELSDGSELYLRHDGAYLYIGLRSRARGNGVTSICLDRGKEVVVLHSSAALGTAVYQQDGPGWQQTRPFSWQCRSTSYSAAAQAERERFLEREQWLANNGNMGVPEEVEAQIAMPEGALRLAVTYLGPPGFDSVAAWPAGLRDGCRNPELITGPIPQRLELAPETWVTVRTARAPSAP